MRLLTRALPLLCTLLSLGGGCGASEALDSDGGADTDSDGVADSSDALSCDGVVGEGYGEGNISMDWTLNDVDGNGVSRYDDCGRAI